MENYTDEDYEEIKKIYDETLNHFCNNFSCRPEDAYRLTLYFLQEISKLKYEIKKLKGEKNA